MERDDDHKKWGSRRAPRLDLEQYEWEPPESPRDSVVHDGEQEPEGAKMLLSLWRGALDAMRDAVVRQHELKQQDADAPEEERAWGSARTADGLPN